MLIKHFTEFVAGLTANVGTNICGRAKPLADDRDVPVSEVSVHELHVLTKVCRFLATSGTDPHKRGDVWYEWLPMYGCALQRTKLSASKTKLEVIYMDGWERSLHFLPTGECVHGSVPKTFKVEFCADLDSELEKNFASAFTSELREAQNNTKNRRNAARNPLGHQKTPQFIAAVVRRAVDSVTGNRENVSSSAHGGTTDVGQHTGGRPRDTCWALVQTAIEHNLCCGNGLFRKTMVLYQLTLLQRKVDEASGVFCKNAGGNVKDGCDSVDDLFFMLQVIIKNVVELLDKGYNVTLLKEQCKTLRCSLDGLVDSLNRQTATKYVLPGEDDLKQLKKLQCGVEIASPRRETDSTRNETKEERQSRAMSTLGACQFVDVASCSLENLLEWENTKQVPESYKCIMVLRTFEEFIFTKSHELNSGGKYERDNDFLEEMQSLVTRYQKAASEWRKLPRMTSVLQVEYRSREMLVIWTSFCLVHQKCVKDFPLCIKYNIALNWMDLKVAVLSSKTGISALQNVAKYIRNWNNETRGTPLFHLSDQRPTFDFGRTFSESSSEIKTAYEREVECWESHVLEQWNYIERKKEAAVQHRAEISKRNSDLYEKQSTLAAEEARLLEMYPQYNQVCYRYSTTKSRLQEEIRNIRSSIQQTEKILSQTLRTPNYLVRPLPSTKNDAYQVLFMLLMPRKLEILGNLCLSAQRLIAPPKPTTEMMKLPQLSNTTWQEFHRTYTRSGESYAASKLFVASPAKFSLPDSYGPRTVDELSSLVQYKSESVWNLNWRGSSMMWKDFEGVNMNPFNTTPTNVTSGYIETMPESFRQLQWMNNWPGENDTRGNMVYAKLHLQPRDFKKSSFITLGSLRAFPNQQFRKLQCAILNDALLWANPCVETVVRQSQYQVGDLTDETVPHLQWKTDMLQDKQGLETFCTTLNQHTGTNTA